jgi:hypothetical protein
MGTEWFVPFLYALAVPLLAFLLVAALIGRKGTREDD